MSYIHRSGMDIKSTASLRANQRGLYEYIAKYYTEIGNNLLHEFTHFECQDGSIFNINSDEFFNHLSEHPEDLSHYTKVLFDAKRFGHGLESLIQLVKSEDENIQRNIDRIRNIINDVHNNSTFINSFKNLFNKYIAKNFSTNPMIRRDLILLRTTFGDSNKFDKWLSDVGELSNKEIQVVAKYVYSVLNGVTRVTVPKIQKEFIEKYEEYAEGCDFSKFIDEKTGQFINEYNDNYIEDLKKHKEETEKLREEKDSAYDRYKNGDITYGEVLQSYLNYYNKKLERDLWMVRNTEQPMIVDYYNAKIKILLIY